MHSESESCIFVMYRFDAEHPGQSLYTRTIVRVILLLTYLSHSCDNSTCTAVLTDSEAGNSNTKTIIVHIWSQLRVREIVAV